MTIGIVYGNTPHGGGILSNRVNSIVNQDMQRKQISQQLGEAVARINQQAQQNQHTESLRTLKAADTSNLGWFKQILQAQRNATDMRLKLARLRLNSQKQDAGQQKKSGSLVDGWDNWQFPKISSDDVSAPNATSTDTFTMPSRDILDALGYLPGGNN